MCPHPTHLFDGVMQPVTKSNSVMHKLMYGICNTIYSLMEAQIVMDIAQKIAQNPTQCAQCQTRHKQQSEGHAE